MVVLAAAILFAATPGKGPDAAPDTSTLPDTTRVRRTVSDTVRYEAALIRYDLQQRIVFLAGNAVARYQDVTLYADTITYRIDDDLFYAVGLPRLEEKGDVTVGDTLSYNVGTRRGSVRYATTRTANEYFTGCRIIKSEENHLYIEDGEYTTCADPEHPHYSFYGHALKVIPRDKGVSRPVVLNIGEVPVAAFPYYILPLERGRRSGLLMPGWGGHPTRGGYMDNIGYYWAPNDYMDFTLAGTVREFNDFVLTGRSQYRLRYWLDGSVNANYHIGTDYRANRQEWTLSFGHNQNLLPDGSFTLRGNGSLASARRNEKTFYQSYSNDPAEIIKQDLRTSLALEKRLVRLNSGIRLGWNRSQNLLTDRVTEDIPSLSFSIPSRPIIPLRGNVSRPDPAGVGEDGARWYNKIYYSYGMEGKVHRDIYLTDTLPGYTRPGITQSFSLSAPQKLFKWFTITPTFSARLSSFYGYMDTAAAGYDTIHPVKRDTIAFLHPDSSYEREDYFPVRIDTLILPATTSRGEPDTTYVLSWAALKPDSFPYYDTAWDKFGHDFVWQTGVALSTTLYGLFPLRIFNLAGIRHTLSPSISYTFVPEHAQDKQFFPIGIPYDRGHPRSQRIALRVGNLFQGKVVKPSESAAGKPVEKKFTLLTFDVGTSYDFEADKKRWADLQVVAGTRLKFMGLSHSSFYWLYDRGDLGGDLTYPRLRQYSFEVTPNNFSVAGRFWDGDRLSGGIMHPVRSGPPPHSAGQQWRLGLTPRFSFSSVRKSPDDEFVSRRTYSLGASASLSFTRSWSLSWNSTYDFVKNAFVSHALNFRCDLECWDLVFNWTPTGVQPGYFYFRVNIKKIPDIKWELRD